MQLDGVRRRPGGDPIGIQRVKKIKKSSYLNVNCPPGVMSFFEDRAAISQTFPAPFLTKSANGRNEQHFLSTISRSRYLATC